MTNLIKLVILACTMFLLPSCSSDKPVEKNYTLGTLNLLDSTSFTGKELKQIIINEANKMAYVLTDEGVLYHINLQSGLGAMLEPTNWRELKLTDHKKDNQPGNARLDEKERAPKGNRKIYLTKDGILLTASVYNSSVGFNDAVLAYFEKAALVPTFAWVGSKIAGLGFSPANFVTALAVEHNGQEFFLVQLDLDNTLLTVAKGPHNFKGEWTNDSGAKFNKVKLAADQDRVYIVETDKGISVIDKSKLSQDAQAAVLEGDIAKWEMLSGTSNSRVNQAIHHQGKLYISLSNIGLNTGGVVVYDISSNTTVGPQQSVWDNKHAVDLRVQHGQVWGSIYELPNTVLGDSIIDTDGMLKSPPLSMTSILSNRFISEQDLRDKTFADGKTFYDNVTAEFELLLSSKKPVDMTYLGDDIIFKIDEVYFILTHEKKSFALTGGT